jgi:hypothetical protein
MGLLGIGWYFAVCIVGGIVGGMLLDDWLETERLFTLIGLFLGLALAAYGGYKALKRVMAISNTTKGREQD